MVLPRVEGTLLWRKEIPYDSKLRHVYCVLHEPDKLGQIQEELRSRGLPELKLIHRYRHSVKNQERCLQGVCFEYDAQDQETPHRGVMNLLRQEGIGLDVCGENRDPEHAFWACIKELGVNLEWVPVSSVAYANLVPIDWKCAEAETYHWNPWEQWPLEEVNHLLMRFGLPPRKRLELPDGRRIYHVVQIWKSPYREQSVTSVAFSCGTPDWADIFEVEYSQGHQVVLALAFGEQLAVDIEHDFRYEREIWHLPEISLPRKPTNSTLRSAILPNIPAAKISFSRLGDELMRGERRIYEIVRVAGDFREAPADLSALFGGRAPVWKSWQEIFQAMHAGKLDSSAELMVTKILRRFPGSAEPFRSQGAVVS